MTYKLKALAAALMALAALGALGAAGASAQFESEAEETQLTISSNSTQQFKVKASAALTTECTTIVYDTTDKYGWFSTSIHTTPTLFNCHPLLGQEVTVDMNGCGYELHLAEGSTTGTTDIECGEKPIQITVGSLCTYSIGTQTGLGNVSYANVGEGSTREIEVTTEVTGITSTKSGSFLCPAGSSEGAFAGSFTLTGENSAGTEHIGVFVD